MKEKTEKAGESSELLQLVSFRIGNEEFGIDIMRVQEINKMTNITEIPNSPDFVEGIINLRGRVIPVIDLRTRLRLEKRKSDKDSRIIIVEIEAKTIGFIVDSVNEVLRVPASTFENPPEIVSGIDTEFIQSVGKLEDRLLLLIDLNKILHKEESEKLMELTL